MHAWVAALNRQDMDGVVANFAADVSFLGTSSQAVLGTPADIRQYFTEVFAKFAPLSVELGELHISALTTDSVVVTGFDRWRITLAGTPAEGIGRLSVAIARRDGQWRIVSFHRSAMPD